MNSDQKQNMYKAYKGEAGRYTASGFIPAMPSRNNTVSIDWMPCVVVLLIVVLPVVVYILTHS